MFFEAFSDESVEDMIDDCAQRMIDDYDEDVCEEERLLDVVENAAMYACDAIAIIAYYGVFDALKGCDYEDSPIAQFERDVWCKYLELKEEN